MVLRRRASSIVFSIVSIRTVYFSSDTPRVSPDSSACARPGQPSTHCGMGDDMHVLVVDDSAVVRQAFSMLLGTQFTIDTAADAIIAERKMQKRVPDVMVLDLQMPRMDGLTF